MRSGLALFVLPAVLLLAPAAAPAEEDPRQVSGDLPHALGALGEVTQQCVACHAGYRLVAEP